MKKITTDKFIIKAQRVHGNRYDYSKTVYTKAKDKIEIICSVHGEFKQTPSAHLRGQGCKKCGDESRTGTTTSFIIKAQKVHGNKYSYSKVNYTTAKNKVTIVCPVHGNFEQEAYSHLKGKGCWECSVLERADATKLSLADFVIRASAIHNNKYDYSKTIYKLIDEKLEIVCPKHGSFWQRATNHLAGKGCKKCKSESQSNRLSHTKNDFVERANKTHNSKYDYSDTNYTTAGEKVRIVCPVHGEFFQRPNDHLRRNSKYGDGRGCPKCAHHISKPEICLRDYISELLPKFKTIENGKHKVITDDDVIFYNNRGLIKNSDGNCIELDIVIPKLNLAFEFNGVHYHSTKYKHPSYHKDKSEACYEIGLRLVHIWEDDWNNKNEIVKSFIRALIQPIPSIFGRKTVHKEIDKNLARDFCENNHIQGSASCSKAYALYHDGDVVSVCTFVERGYGFELNRHACSSNIRVVGALGKHIKNFSRIHPNTTIKSFCDTSVFNGGSYEKAGFELEAILDPDYRYVVHGERKHKFAFRRKNLPIFLGDKFDSDLSEVKNMENNGFYRIFDCGKLRFIYK